jgi:hypothetical protein
VQIFHPYKSLSCSEHGAKIHPTFDRLGRHLLDKMVAVPVYNTPISRQQCTSSGKNRNLAQPAAAGLPSLHSLTSFAPLPQVETTWLSLESESRACSKRFLSFDTRLSMKANLREGSNRFLVIASNPCGVTTTSPPSRSARMSELEGPHSNHCSNACNHNSAVMVP